MEPENTVNDSITDYGQPLDFQQVWRIFQETDRMFQETDKKFQETDRKFLETDKKFQETDRQIKENDHILTEKFKETEKLIRQNLKSIRELDRLFTSQWGKLIESLVEGDLVRLLNKRGIKVERTIQRAQGNRNGENFEYDIIALNGSEVVIVEVKTTLRQNDIDHFHEKLWKLKTYMPEFKDKKVFGAVAYITADGSSNRMAENLGLFVIRATGSSSSIVNKKDFQPKVF